MDEQLGWAPASFLRHSELDVEDDFIIKKFPRGKGATNFILSPHCPATIGPLPWVRLGSRGNSTGGWINLQKPGLIQRILNQSQYIAFFAD